MHDNTISHMQFQLTSYTEHLCSCCLLLSIWLLTQGQSGNFIQDKELPLYLGVSIRKVGHTHTNQHVLIAPGT